MSATEAEINALFNQHLGRDAGNLGMQGFIDSGQSVDDILNTITNSTEYANNTAKTANAASETEINGLFNQYLGRDAGSAGMAGFTDRQESTDDIYNTIMNSSEYANKIAQAPVTEVMAQPTATQASQIADQYAYMSADPASNPYLEGALQRGIDQSQVAYDNMEASSTKNLLENVMPSLRNESISNGQMGSSRQGIAEGMALNSYNSELQDARNNYATDSLNATLQGQSNAYEAGMDRNINRYNIDTQATTAANQLDSTNWQNAFTNNLSMYNLNNSMAGYGDMYDYTKQQGGLGTYSSFQDSGVAPTPTTLTQNTGTAALSGATAGLGMASGFADAYKKYNTDTFDYSTPDADGFYG